MDLASEIAGADPVGDIVSKVEEYWQTDRQYRLVNSCVGIFADNATNDDGDMIHDISADAGTEDVPVAATDANKISDNAVIEACATMGDRQADLSGIAVHSVVYKRMQKEQMIDFIRSADNTILIPTYLGKRVIVDDGLYAVSYGTPVKVRYQTIIFGAGVFAMGAGTNALKATEFSRDPKAGRGSGQDILHSRRQWAIHPLGFTFDYATVADEAPTYAELRTGSMWNRVWDRKRVKMACLISNG